MVWFIRLIVRILLVKIKFLVIWDIGGNIMVLIKDSKKVIVEKFVRFVGDIGLLEV